MTSKTKTGNDSRSDTGAAPDAHLGASRLEPGSKPGIDSRSGEAQAAEGIYRLYGLQVGKPGNCLGRALYECERIGYTEDEAVRILRSTPDDLLSKHVSGWYPNALDLQHLACFGCDALFIVFGERLDAPQLSASRLSAWRTLGVSFGRRA